MAMDKFSQGRAQIRPQIDPGDATSLAKSAMDPETFAASIRSQKAQASPVSEALYSIAAEVAQLEKNIAVLCDRLSPIASPPTTEPGGDSKKPTETSPCEVVDCIITSARRIEDVNAIVNRLVNRLCV